MKVKIQHMSTGSLLISDRFHHWDHLHRESFITPSDSFNVDTQKQKIPSFIRLQFEASLFDRGRFVLLM